MFFVAAILININKARGWVQKNKYIDGYYQTLMVDNSSFIFNDSGVKLSWVRQKGAGLW